MAALRPGIVRLSSARRLAARARRVAWVSHCICHQLCRSPVAATSVSSWPGPQLLWLGARPPSSRRRSGGAPPSGRHRFEPPLTVLRPRPRSPPWPPTRSPRRWGVPRRYRCRATRNRAVFHVIYVFAAGATTVGRGSGTAAPREANVGGLVALLGSESLGQRG